MIGRAASALFLLGVAAMPIVQPFQVHLFGSFVVPADFLFAASGATGSSRDTCIAIAARFTSRVESVCEACTARP